MDPEISSNAETATVRRAVFVDRDGVINEAEVRCGKPYPPPTLAALKIIPGVKDALSRLRRAGYLIIVVTNQPDVAAGRQSRDVVDAMHDALRGELDIDDIKVCFCVEGPHCECYKPKPGMLLEAAREWRIDLSRSYMVGDRWRDIGAGMAAGCYSIFIDKGYSEREPDAPDATVRCLREAADVIAIHGAEASEIRG